MKIARRTWLIILLLGLGLLLGVLFRSFILDNLVQPVALVLWMFWRVLLSVDQKVYWSLPILFALVYAFVRLAQGLMESERTPPPDSNVILDKVKYWRIAIHSTDGEIERPNTLKHELARMLATMYASKQPETLHWQVYGALKQSQLPLPKPVYAFLFPPERPGGRRSFRQVLQAIRHAPRKWARRWTGRDAAEYYQAIEQVLNFMESSLEITNDDKQLDTPKH